MSTLIQIHAESPTAATGCGSCAASKAAWACGEASFVHVLAPSLMGPDAQVHQVMQALVHDLGATLGDDEDGTGLVRSLRLDADEAELALAVPAHCGGGRLADVAFQTLRRLLPDTDIYVTHAP